MSDSRGRFITIEGVEGVGKSTNMVQVTATLDHHGIPWITTREPGGTALSEKIRDLLLDKNDTSMDPLTELLLVFAARVQHVEELIKPNIEKGVWVICDRLDALGRFAPDLTVLLDLPVDVGMARAQARGEYDRFEREGNEFFERVRESFLERAARESRFRVIDASKSLAEVNARVVATIEEEVAGLGHAG
jgi:dTMP kinase